MTEPAHRKHVIKQRTEHNEEMWKRPVPPLKIPKASDTSPGPGYDPEYKQEQQDEG